MGYVWLLVAYAGGMIVGFVLRMVLGRLSPYDGVMHIQDGREKTVYSLELADYPEELRFKKEVIFKVDAPEENLNRD